VINEQEHTGTLVGVDEVHKSLRFLFSLAPVRGRGSQKV